MPAPVVSHAPRRRQTPPPPRRADARGVESRSTRPAGGSPSGTLVAAEIAALPEADFVALVTGDHGLIVDLACDDHEHLTRSVDEIRGTSGVVDVDVSLVLGVAKNEVVR